ncbi:MAG: F0F1 ATP synthase subunit B [Gammaproteobacteria bacterium RIFCSPLOWO2_02_FULL_38_11]|nr:MAG: F0F1 ATP synthase subunit B [Gammaproteobacteria bacterium RIFCSPLOWO2_02_FULL_38_11]
MNLNATLLGQMVTFAVFVGFTMKFVWPPITNALAQRQKRIAEGLAAAERGKHELQLSQEQDLLQLREARAQAGKIIEQAQHKGSVLVEQAKEKAIEEGKNIKKATESELTQQIENVKSDLRKEVALIALQGAEKIIAQHLNPQSHHTLINKIIDEI